MAKKTYFYAVAVGRKSGIYTEWFGPNGAQSQIEGFSGARHQKFTTREAAESFIKQHANQANTRNIDRKRRKPVNRNAAEKPKSAAGQILIYTDGGCINNPGPGGYGVILSNGKKTKELSGGYRLTTNNRMELMACIVALRALKRKVSVLLHSDSKYVVDGITKGWARKWQANGWIKPSDKKPALNSDLWEALLRLCEKHEVEFRWVKGHAGNEYNERCDILAKKAAQCKALPADEAYERKDCPFPNRI